jgi:hypothetical protein
MELRVHLLQFYLWTMTAEINLAGEHALEL